MDMVFLRLDAVCVLTVSPKVFGDERGFFLETWSRKRYQDIGINIDFVQDNQY